MYSTVCVYALHVKLTSRGLFNLPTTQYSRVKICDREQYEYLNILFIIFQSDYIVYPANSSLLYNRKKTGVNPIT
jgi:hypothetical protein